MPRFDDHLSLSEGVAHLWIEGFVSEFTGETFSVAVFPRAPSFDAEGSYACSFKPLASRLGR